MDLVASTNDLINAVRISSCRVINQHELRKYCCERIFDLFENMTVVKLMRLRYVMLRYSILRNMTNIILGAGFRLDCLFK